MLICGCGEAEKTPCDELKDIWKEICAIPDGLEYPCFPCSCALCGRYWDIPTRIGMPDPIMGSCTDQLSCREGVSHFVETCLAHAPTDPFERPLPAEWVENECDPRHSYNTWLCDDGMTYNPAFPGLIEKGVVTYDCGDK
jgi:hypothetical protein